MNGRIINIVSTVNSFLLNACKKFTQVDENVLFGTLLKWLFLFVRMTFDVLYFYKNEIILLNEHHAKYIKKC